ncbi:MAG: DUF2807 domain-containing protein [Paludibacter sp.]|nr:DUF2807 domain-containing protein [Paludibacter sp.]MCM1575510.1 DUF2807 domain-containing protein [Bacteroides sp.]
MKKTLTINLNGIVFNIDDDAYAILSDYLEAIESRLESSDDTAEIMQDIEARIAELFGEMLSRQRIEVVDANMTECVMEQLGSPDAFVDAEGDDASADANEAPRKHRFYRDVDNRILGGVCAGFAAYVGWDVFWVRVLVLLCTFFWGITIPIYLMVWAIASGAVTAAQRLEMRGEPASVENIKCEYERMKENESRHSSSRGCRTVLEVCLKLCLGLILVCVIAPLLIVLGSLCVAFLGVAFGMFGGMSGFLAGLPLAGGLEIFGGNGWLVALYVFLVVLVIGVPLFALIYWVVKYVRKRQHPIAAFWWVVGLLWLVSLLGAGAMTIYAKGSLSLSDTFVSKSDGATTEVRDVEPFYAVVAQGAIDLELKQDSNRLLTIAAVVPSNITTEVREGVLYIGCVDNYVETAEVVLAAPDVRSVDIAGASKVKTDGMLRSESLTLKLKGASKADLQVETQKLIIDVQGASNLKMEGVARNMDVRLLGAGNIDAYKLLTDTASVYCAGGSKAAIACAQSLSAQAAGASKISYKGNPTVEKSIEVGASKIKRK